MQGYKDIAKYERMVRLFQKVEIQKVEQHWQTCLSVILPTPFLPSPPLHPSTPPLLRKKSMLKADLQKWVIYVVELKCF